jgi:hypothetical protein
MSTAAAPSYGAPMPTMDDVSNQLLLLEYERSSQLCNHVDNLRNVIASFFLTLVAGLAVAVSKYVDGTLPRSRLGTSKQVAAAVCTGVAVLGMLFVMVLARLRRVQLERYLLMNGILDGTLDPSVRRLIPFQDATVALPGRPRALHVRLTGSYLWTLVIILPTAGAFAVTALVLLSPLHHGPLVRTSTVAAIAALVILVLDRLYYRLSNPPEFEGTA